MIQKKLAKKLYGTISGTFFRSRYRDFNGEWRDRIWDARFMTTIDGGYKPNNRWEFSVRWTYAGGMPYTPFDLEESKLRNKGVLDENRVNEERLPDYHSLNIRADRRFYFRASNLIGYLAIWNVYNQTNIAGYYWNELKNEPKESFQWGIIPALGLEYEF